MYPQIRPHPFWTVVAASLLAACSTTQLVYNNVDTLLRWELDGFMNFGPAQRELFDREFPRLWNWHRGTQLPLYVRDLRELGDAARQPMTPAQAMEFLERLTGHFERAWREVHSEAVGLLRSLDDAQVNHLLESMAERRAEQAEETEALTGQERRAEAAEEMKDLLHNWVGRLSDEQERRIEAWAAARRDDPELLRAYRAAWSERFAALLARRAEQDFPNGLHALVTRPAVQHRAEIEALRDHNRRMWAELVADLSQTLSAEQRHHLRDELEDLAGDLEELAAEVAEPV